MFALKSVPVTARHRSFKYREKTAVAAPDVEDRALRKRHDLFDEFQLRHGVCRDYRIGRSPIFGLCEVVGLLFVPFGTIHESRPSQSGNKTDVLPSRHSERDLMGGLWLDRPEVER
jgi:hypothetical protein